MPMKFRWLAGSLLLAGTLLLSAEHAAAQPCGDLAVAAGSAAEDIHDLVAEYGPIEPAACVKIAKGLAASCHRTVAAVAACTVNHAAGAFRMGVAACRGDGGNPSVCSANYRELLAEVQDSVRAQAGTQHALCGDFAGDFLGDCLAGF
jgi:hypothetical protein